MQLSDLPHRLRRWRDKFNFTWGRLCFDRKLPIPECPVKVSSILFIRGDGKIGDSLVSSFVYRELKRSQPSLQIGVLCTPNTVNMYQDNANIDHVHAYPKRAKVWQVPALCRALPQYDAVVFLAETVKPRDFRLLATLNAQYNIGIAEHVALLNINIREQVRGLHFQQYFNMVAQAIGTYSEDLRYEYAIPSKVEAAVRAFVAKLNAPYIAINGFGNSKNRCFTSARFIEIIRALRKQQPDYPIILLSSPKTEEQVKDIIKQLADKQVHYMPKVSTVEQSAALIKFATLFISVDTATVHIANAMQVPMVAIYRNNKENHAMWHPNYDKAVSLFTRSARSEVEEVNIGEFELQDLLTQSSNLLNAHREYAEKTINEST